MKVETREIGGLVLLGTGVGTLIYAGLTKSFMKGVGGGLIATLGIHLMRSSTPVQPIKKEGPAEVVDSPPARQPTKPKTKKKKKKRRWEVRTARKKTAMAVLEGPGQPTYGVLKMSERQNLVKVQEERGGLYKEIFEDETMTLSALLDKDLSGVENIPHLIEFGRAAGAQLYGKGVEEPPLQKAIENGYPVAVLEALEGMTASTKTKGSRGTVWHSLAYALHNERNDHWREIGDHLRRMCGSRIKVKHEGQNPIEWLHSVNENATNLEIFKLWVPKPREKRRQEIEAEEMKVRQEKGKREDAQRVGFAFK